jgi:DNA-binding CsgD family transcriptional regulator
LAEGLSLTEIGVLENRDPSTVGYWVEKYGLTANGQEKYAPKGGISKSQLEELLGQDLTLRQIAEELGRSQSTVNYWLRRHEVKTRRGHGRRAAALAAMENGTNQFDYECVHHGVTTFFVFKGGRSRCGKCNSEAVQRRRETTKRTLAQERGGQCAICGYRRYIGALQFHHVDPKEKKFGISGRGITRSIARSREEAAKCILLCANCHAEVEGGVSECPRLE